MADKPPHHPVVREPAPIVDPILDHQKPKPNTHPIGQHPPGKINFEPPLHSGEPGAVTREPNVVVDEYLNKAHYKTGSCVNTQCKVVDCNKPEHLPVVRKPNEIVDFILDKKPVEPHKDHPHPPQPAEPEVPKVHVPIVEDILDKKFHPH